MSSALGYAARALVCGGLLVAASTASADDAAGPGARAVLEKRATIAASPEAHAYFQHENGAPQWMPDGTVIQYFTGAQGDGAIYWTAIAGATLLYGPVLEHFEASGEDELGESVADPLAGPGEGCVASDVVRRQPFARVLVDAEAHVRVETRWVCVGPAGAYRGAIAR